MDQLTTEMVTSGGVIGVLAFVVVALLRGWLVPKGTIDEIRSDRDAWRAAAEAETTARETSAKQLDKLLELMQEAVAWQRAHP